MTHVMSSTREHFPASWLSPKAKDTRRHSIHPTACLSSFTKWVRLPHATRHPERPSHDQSGVRGPRHPPPTPRISLSMNNDGTSQSTTTAHTLLGQDVPTRSASINVAVDPVALVITECITVTSAMRKHARWAHSSVSAILGGGSTKPIPMRIQDQNAKRAVAGLKVADESDALAERWGIRGKKGKSMQDNPLILAFSKLRIELKGCKGAACCTVSDYDIYANRSSRHSRLRHSFPITSILTSHSVLFDFRADHITRSHCYHEVPGLQHR